MIASMVGVADVQSVEDALLELTSRGVPGFTEDGVLYSRRIVSELDRSSGNAERCRRYRERQKSKRQITATMSQRASEATWSRASRNMPQRAATENNIGHNSSEGNDLPEATRERHGIESESEPDNTPLTPLQGENESVDGEVNPRLQQARNIIARTGIAPLCGIRQQTILVQLIEAHGPDVAEAGIVEALGRRVARPVEFAAQVLTSRLASQTTGPVLNRTEQNLARLRAIADAIRTPNDPQSGNERIEP